ncbi:hypothetical protein DSM112329_05449 [Paraconexibacter sp. AEG42_29]|uniref:DUF2029 domain-containing protein n=1 Tax=Paraconexibacter sp. AEG42_29 TaxID=2997339 RepID=A0AAU7B3H0_9ACTN
MRRLPAALLAVLLLLLLVAGPASADSAPIATAAPGQPAGAEDGNALTTPPSLDQPPVGHRLTGNQAQALADKRPEIIQMKKDYPGAYPGVFLKGRQRWQISYYAKTKPLREIGQVTIEDRSAKVQESYTGYKVAWSMARGYPGAFGRKVNSPWVWIPMTVAFLLPFLGPRRRWRPSWLMLDVSVLAAFGISVAYFNDAQIDRSVPSEYILLAYVLARMLWIGVVSRPPAAGAPRRGAAPIAIPVTWLAIGLVFLVGFRVGLNITNSNVIDVGYSGVIGAEKLTGGEKLYGNWPKDNEHGDTYGPVAYAAYIPFTQALGWSGRWDDLPAAHGAAVAFDLLCMLLLFLLGRQIRGPGLGVVLSYCWAAFPLTFYAQMCNSNDALVSVFLIAALLAAARPGRRAVFIALGGLTKFATLAVAPLFATHALGHRPGDPEDAPTTARSRARTFIVFSVAFGITALIALLPVIWHGQSPSLVYDRTLGFQTSRGSPFSIWGLYEIPGLQHVWQALSVLLAVGLAVLPRRRDMTGLAACAAAIVIALQAGVTHWFYLYIVWFFPLVMVALLAPFGDEEETDGADPDANPAMVPAPVVTAA